MGFVTIIRLRPFDNKTANIRCVIFILVKLFVLFRICDLPPLQSQWRSEEAAERVDRPGRKSGGGDKMGVIMSKIGVRTAKMRVITAKMVVNAAKIGVIRGAPGI